MLFDFTNILFLLLFIGIFISYWLLARWKKIQNSFLLVVSLILYGITDQVFILLLFLEIGLNYIYGILIQKCNKKNQKICLYLILIFNISILVIFKYFNFFLESFITIFDLVFNYHIQNSIVLELFLPLGLSFYTFSLISYNLDLYWNHIEPITNIVNFALFITFFPKIIAGPIERADHFINQINNTKSFDWEKMSRGIDLIFLGYYKKLIIVNYLTRFILSTDFYDDPTQYSSIASFLIIIMYTLHIYADFSGYTDIARGFSLMLGIELSENFKQPYLSTNIKEFWSRWHISLTNWFRDYLYIPLGGNRKGNARTYINVIFVFILSGLWHGAGINFLIWGAIHGFLLVIYTFYNNQILKRKTSENKILTKSNHPIKIFIKKTFAWLFTFVLVSFAWIFFAVDNFSIAIQIIYKIIQFPVNFQMQSAFSSSFDMSQFRKLSLAFVSLFLIDLVQNYFKKDEIIEKAHWILRGTIYFIIFIMIISLLGVEVPQFIYQGF